MIEFYEVGGTVKDRKLVLTRRERWNLNRALTQFKDGPVTLRIEIEQRKRSHAQNRFWHGIVIPLFAEHCGNSLAEMKDALSLELIPRTVHALDGTEKTIPGHTSSLSVEQFNDLIARAQQLGAEMGIYIPDPNEVAA